MKKIYTDQEFLEWVREQDDEVVYDFEKPGSCAFAQFLESKGYLYPSVGFRDWFADDDHGNIPSISAQALLETVHETDPEYVGDNSTELYVSFGTLRVALEKRLANV